MFNPLAVLPLHLACQLLVPENSSDLNVTLAGNTALPKTATVLPDGYTIFNEIGAAYKVYQNKLQWHQARTVCIAEGSHLAIIDTFRKVEIIKGIKKDEAIPWVGFHRLFDINEWTEVKSGLPSVSLPWDGEAWLSIESRRCAAHWKNQGGLFAETCTEVHEFVCELPIIKN